MASRHGKSSGPRGNMILGKSALDTATSKSQTGMYSTNYQEMPMPKLRAQGFTLIELLVVIGILAVLLAITLVAINPRKQFQQANDTQRQSDVNAILNAVNQYTVDNQGQLPPALAAAVVATPYAISTSGVDICGDVVPEYIAALPTDPLSASHAGRPVVDNTPTGVDSCASYDTEYVIERTANNRISVWAPNTELAASISATR